MKIVTPIIPNKNDIEKGVCGDIDHNRPPMIGAGIFKAPRNR